MCRMLNLDKAFPDKQLAEDLEGFPFVDALPQCHFSALASPPKDKGIPFSSSLLRTHRETLNQVVLAGIKELPYSEDLLTLTQGNEVEGYMNGPSP